MAIPAYLYDSAKLLVTDMATTARSCGGEACRNEVLHLLEGRLSSRKWMCMLPPCSLLMGYVGLVRCDVYLNDS
jgi:hypothetical protein